MEHMNEASRKGMGFDGRKRPKFPSLMMAEGILAIVTGQSAG
jgi:hypothetical protein